jgi:transcriptional regulator with XRE-family HTH domain
LSSSKNQEERGFPERLARARTAAGFSRRALGRMAQVSEAYISRLERGQRIASPVVRQSLARALGVDPEWLASGQGSLRADRERPDDGVPDRLPAAIEHLIDRERLAPEVGRLPRPFLQRYMQRVEIVRGDITSLWQATRQDLAQRIERELGDFRARLLAESRAERQRRPKTAGDDPNESKQ